MNVNEIINKCFKCYDKYYTSRGLLDNCFCADLKIDGKSKRLGIMKCSIQYYY